MHGCGDDEQIAVLGGSNRLTDNLLRKSAVRGTPEYLAIETLLKGKEVRLPYEAAFSDKDGNAPRDSREMVAACRGQDLQRNFFAHSRSRSESSSASDQILGARTFHG